jgi:short-subunit dehydrogenase
MIVLITGASSGIGRELVRHYLREGHTVVAVARRAPRLTELGAEHPDAGERFACFAADVSDRVAMASIVAGTERMIGPIDLAIASAGMADEHTTPDFDPTSLERSLAINVCGVFNVLAPVAAAMRPRGHGHLVAISSLASERSLPRMTAYCASKAALNSGMEGLDLLLRGTGISVSTISPGFIATEMTDGRVASRRCMPLDRAMAKIIRAIRHRRRVCRFPASQHLLLRALGLVPTSVRQIALRRAFHPLFRHRPITAAADAAPRSVT